MLMHRPRALAAVLLSLGLAALTTARSSAQAGDIGPLPEQLFPQLNSILDKALEQSPQMLLKNIELAQADATVYLSRAQLWPQASLNGSYSINESAVAEANAVSSRSDGVFYSASVYQPVFHWGTLRAQAESSRIGVMIAEKNYAEAYRTLVVSIRAQFLNLILKKLTLRNAQFSAARAAKTLATEEEKLKLGRAAPSVLVHVRLTRDETQLSADRTAEDLAQAKRFLLRLAGMESLADELVPDNLPALDFAAGSGTPLVSRFVHGGVEETFQATSFRHYIEQADLNYKVARYRLFPKFGFSIGLAQANTTNAAGNFVTQTGVFSQSANLSFSWPIFDGFATKGAKLQALLNRSYYERQLTNYVDTTSDQARNLGTQVEFAARAMAIATTRRDMAEGALKLAEENAARGTVSEFAVSSATLAFQSSEVQAASSRIEMLSRWSELLSLLQVDPALARIPAHHRSHARK